MSLASGISGTRDCRWTQAAAAGGPPTRAALKLGEMGELTIPFLGILLIALLATIASVIGSRVGPALFGLGFLALGALAITGGNWLVALAGCALVGAGIVELIAAREYHLARATEGGPSEFVRLKATLVGLAGSISFLVLIWLIAMAMSTVWSYRSQSPDSVASGCVAYLPAGSADVKAANACRGLEWDMTSCSLDGAEGTVVNMTNEPVNIVIEVRFSQAQLAANSSFDGMTDVGARQVAPWRAPFFGSGRVSGCSARIDSVRPSH